MPIRVVKMLDPQAAGAREQRAAYFSDEAAIDELAVIARAGPLALVGRPVAVPLGQGAAAGRPAPTETVASGRRSDGMIRLRTPSSAPVLEIEVAGRITRADVETTFAEIEAAIGDRDDVRVLEEIGSLEGIEPTALWRDLQLGLPLMGRFSHAAVVTDVRWVEALTKLAAPVLQMRLRVFPHDRLDEARAWLAGETD